MIRVVSWGGLVLERLRVDTSLMQRDRIDADVVFVGAGPASLSGALHLSRLVREHKGAQRASSGVSRSLDDLTVMVVEKGRDIGSHALSGAVIDPRGFDELLSGFPGEEPPYESRVEDDELRILTRRGSFRSPLTPPPLKNKGYSIASLGSVVKWLADLCERNGVEVYPGFPATELLFEGSQVSGVRIGDRGRNSQGDPKPNFEPGIDVVSNITVLGEGPRGTLSRQAERRLSLNRESEPQIYAVGVKEIWKLPNEGSSGRVIHTMGHPLGTEELGGGFIYGMGDLLSVGFVVGLDYSDPMTDGHELLQQFKQHPFVRSLLEGGKVISYGAKAIPEGGYYSMPQLYADGMLLVGDSGGFLNPQRLKGIHLAIKSGMLAAETIFEALLEADYSSRALSRYQDSFEKSWAREELWRARNFRQMFQNGFWSGMLRSGWQVLTGGRGSGGPVATVPGHRRLKRCHGEEAAAVNAGKTEFDGKYTFDKLTDVYFSDTSHEEDQPCHLKILDFNICQGRCVREYANPCQHFCPAGVYEIANQDTGAQLQLNFTNCVHCKTCDIMDPYQIIVWTPPEGEGGPDYKNM